MQRYNGICAETYFSPKPKAGNKAFGEKNGHFGEMYGEIIVQSSIYSYLWPCINLIRTHMLETSTFSYAAFDRQVLNLAAMVSVLIDGWEDYSSMEMNIDLKSLTMKAAKVCYLADEDRARQSESITQERESANSTLLKLIDDLLVERLSPFLMQVLEKIRQGEGLSGKSHPTLRHNISDILPQLAEMTNSTCIEDIVETTAVLEKQLKKNKPTTLPGMTDVERFWMLYELFTLICYLHLHFENMFKLTHIEFNPDDIGRMLMASIQQYADDEEGSRELACYLEALRFDHGGVLTIDVLKEARVALRQEVPQSLQLCFMRHINDIDEMGRELLKIKDKTIDDIKALLIVVAKWQMLTRELEKLMHPHITEEDLPNEVFHSMMHDKRISMKDLRQRIERMLPLVTRKNHWFCVWSVLNYHNLIKNTNTEAFARQMLSPEWFGNTRGILSFTGDTLREYAGYFTATTFRIWDKASYDLYCKTHNKKKWSPTLCDRMKQLCERMNEAFIGQVT